jgi:hypothetical protein
MCGRPVFDFPAIVNEVAPPPIGLRPPGAGGLPNALPDALRAAQLSVGFGNPVALRVAFLMSLGIMLLTLIPGVVILSPLWWLVAGSGGVLLYRRLTGLSLSVRAGARLGSITGVLAFLSLVVIIALMFATSGNEVFQAMVKQNPETSQVLNNPPALVVGVGLFLVLLFALVVGICAAGGALGARYVSRDAKV